LRYFVGRERGKDRDHEETEMAKEKEMHDERGRRRYLRELI
jgi:hypothetical protein